MLDLSKYTTEARNPRTQDLDEMTPRQIVDVMNAEDHKVAEAVHEVADEVAQAVTWATQALKEGGRIIYFGAGTSGRLGVLDAVECPPTFGVDPGVVVGIIAGGEHAFVQAVEGAEDSLTLCAQDLKAHKLTRTDFVVGLAASGRTPYVIGGLRYAKQLGCKTVAIACNKGSEVGKVADLAIEPVPGPEVVTGSTRLKAGTAEKMILNMISTGAMVGCGKVFENLMVDVQQTNKKLEVRAQNIVLAATGCTREEAKNTLRAAHGSAKTAIVMILANLDFKEAEERLAEAEGSVRRAIARQ